MTGPNISFCPCINYRKLQRLPSNILASRENYSRRGKNETCPNYGCIITSNVAKGVSCSLDDIPLLIVAKVGSMVLKSKVRTYNSIYLYILLTFRSNNDPSITISNQIPQSNTLLYTSSIDI